MDTSPVHTTPPVEEEDEWGRSSSNKKNFGSSISGKQIGKKSIWSGKKLSSGEDGSSPGIKRRRMRLLHNQMSSGVQWLQMIQMGIECK
ncbi:hypothetical protein Q3G72_023353 [Acer saccharum]|nr:hypothetical protein Q3G72_023353 [Acer saccharum]